MPEEIDDAPSHVLCMRCFRLLDKFFKLKQELDLAEQEATACVRVRFDTATPISLMVQQPVVTPVQRKRLSQNHDSVATSSRQLSPAVSVRGDKRMHPYVEFDLNLHLTDSCEAS